MGLKHCLRPILCAAVVALGSCLVFTNSSGAGETDPVTVFAAASTTNAIDEIAALFAARQHGKVVSSFASSSTLAKQIENGAPADIFISADQKWMDYLEDRKMIRPGCRFDLLGNRIVLIAPADSSLERIEVQAGFPLAAFLGEGRLAMGDPDHVPAGVYGKQALERLGAWNSVESMVARAKDVRAALALVERGEVPLGLVYATDAAVSKKVRTIGLFPEDSHPPIVYPAALIRETETAKKFFDFLKTPEAKSVFRKYGFAPR